MNVKHVTVVTGGGKGIGRAIAVRMSQLTSVLVVGRTEADLLSVCEEISQAGGCADYVVGDVTDESTSEAVLQLVKARCWTIRNVVVNAGIAKGGPLATFDADTWRQMFDVNVHGAFYIIKACLPAMIAEGAGSISIISSTSGLKGHKNDSAYSATKFALVGLAQSLADEVRKHNIVVVPICPGFVDTDMTARSIAGLVKYRQVTEQQARDRLASINLQGRILMSEEVAEAVAYCAGEGRIDDSGVSMTLSGASEPRVLQMVNWLQENTRPAKKLLIPISGGSDSALCFALCAMAYPGKVLAVYAGKPEDLRCRKWFESIGPVTYVEEKLQGLSGEIGRFAKFQEMSNALGAWLVSSRNLTEELMGTYSLASRCASFYPLANVWKTEVMELCAYLAIPSEITDSSRRADPDCGRPQEMAEVPLEKVDLFLKVSEKVLPERALSELTAKQQLYLAQVVGLNRWKGDLKKGPRLHRAVPR